MQVFWTILAGVIVYVLGQWIQRFVLEPIKELKQTIARVSFLLLANQAVITNASNKDEQLQRDIKALAASLVSTQGQIPTYHIVSRVFGLPPSTDVTQAARELNGIAFDTGPLGKTPRSVEANAKALRNVARLLKNDTTYLDRN